MDIYTLDDQLRRVSIYDSYQSFIWTERYNTAGEFELVTSNSRGVREQFVEGTLITIRGSDRIMRVDTQEINTSDSGDVTLTISGKSLEFVLDDRVGMFALTTLAAVPKLSYYGPPWVLTWDLTKAVLTGSTWPGDELSYIQWPTGSYNPLGSIPINNDPVTFDLEISSLYDVNTKISEMYKYGWRIVRSGDSPILKFEIFTGDDRTTSQQVNPAVVFSESMDSLSNVKSLRSLSGYKNMAYVFSQNGTAVVYGDNTDSSVQELDRRVLTVIAEDINLPAGPDLDAALLQRGLEKLAECRPVIGFDGEIPEVSTYVYGRDYNLGDIVEMRDLDGKVNNMIVTEQIFISDSEGDKSYPTLTFDLLVTPGSWFAWASNQVWEDVNEYWSQV